jgi:hypothetical protein
VSIEVNIKMGSWMSKSDDSDLSLETIIRSSADNYQGRYQRFAEWAEDDDNAVPAAECRNILLRSIVEARRRSKSAHVLAPSSTNGTCGSGSDVGTQSGGGRDDNVNVPGDDNVNVSGNTNFSGDSNTNPLPLIKILDAGCGSGRDILAFEAARMNHAPESPDQLYQNANTKNTKNEPNFKVECSGFDPCRGFVDVCWKKGLTRVTHADFHQYFAGLVPLTPSGMQISEGLLSAQADSGQAPSAQADSGQTPSVHADSASLPVNKLSTPVLPPDHSPVLFDGIFCLAALFHLPCAEIPKILARFHAHLRPETGFLLISLPDGRGNSMGSDGRWKSAVPKEKQVEMLNKSGFEVIEVRKISMYNGRNWVVTLSRKRGKEGCTAAEIGLSR